MIRSMSDDRDGFGKSLLKVGAGFGIGFALYMMFGGNLGLGFGRGSGGLGAGGNSDGSGRGGTQPVPDAQPITARVVPDPSDASKAVIELEGQQIGIADLIARIVTGGRRDVVLIVRGDTRQGAAEAIEQAVSSSGIQIIRPQLSSVPSSPSDPWA